MMMFAQKPGQRRMCTKLCTIKCTICTSVVPGRTLGLQFLETLVSQIIGPPRNWSPKTLFPHDIRPPGHSSNVGLVGHGSFCFCLSSQKLDVQRTTWESHIAHHKEALVTAAALFSFHYMSFNVNWWNMIKQSAFELDELVWHKKY